MPPQQSLVHWAQRIFDGKHPESDFRDAFQLYTQPSILHGMRALLTSPRSESSKCYGTSDRMALNDLLEGGFQKALELYASLTNTSYRPYGR